MASAYIGASLFPAVFGVIAQRISLGIYPYYIVGLGILILIINQLLNQKTKSD